MTKDRRAEISDGGPDHPTGTNKQWEHRRVFFKHYGEGPHTCSHCGLIIESNRYPGLVVHHRDEDQSNNRPSNLAPMHFGCHTSYHSKNRKASPELRERLRQAHLGKSPSLETREKLSAALKGKPWSSARRAAEEVKRGN